MPEDEQEGVWDIKGGDKRARGAEQRHRRSRGKAKLGGKEKRRKGKGGGGVVVSEQVEGGKKPNAFYLRCA